MEVRSEMVSDMATTVKIVLPGGDAVATSVHFSDEGRWVLNVDLINDVNTTDRRSTSIICERKLLGWA